MKLIEKLAMTEVSSFPPRSVMLAQELQYQRQMMLNQVQQSQVQQQQMQDQTQAGGAGAGGASGGQSTSGQGQGQSSGTARIELIVKQPGASSKAKK